jgi:hypothetical protein
MIKKYEHLCLPKKNINFHTYLPAAHLIAFCDETASSNIFLSYFTNSHISSQPIAGQASGGPTVGRFYAKRAGDALEHADKFILNVISAHQWDYLQEKCFT